MAMSRHTCDTGWDAKKKAAPISGKNVSPEFPLSIPLFDVCLLGKMVVPQICSPRIRSVANFNKKCPIGIRN